jgi:pimeloyl-ACP methyl ester carboxylesterase
MRSLVLSGWTQPVDALHCIEPEAAMFDYSAYASPEESFSALEKFERTNCVVAWSLGGQLAIKAIAAGVLKPKHLTLIAAPYQFISSEAVKGMDPLVFKQFRENYATQPTRTKARFHGLVAKGDRDFTRVHEMLGHHPEVENTARWLPWLDTLAHELIGDMSGVELPPTLLVHGTNDAIVPHTQSEIWAKKMPHATLHSWQDVSHAPHLHDAARLRAEIAAHRAHHGVNI